MHKRISPIFSAAGILVLLTACTPSVPPSGDDQSSSVAAVEVSSSASSQTVMEPGADGQEDREASTSGGAAKQSAPAGDDDAAMPVPTAGNPVQEKQVFVDTSGGDSSGMQKSAAPAMSPRVVTITTSNFAFTPNAITVKKGEKITLRLQGKEGMHGFAIADLGINTAVDQGKTVDVTLPTDQAGTFSFRCSIPCGPGHRDMTGTITVQ